MDRREREMRPVPMGPGAAGSGSVLKCEQGGVRSGVRLYISVFLPPPASSSNVAYSVI